MKSACRRAFATFALLCCNQVLAAPYPSEDQFRGAIEKIAGLLKTEGLGLEILDARKSGLTQPLMGAGLNLNNATCRIYFNTRPEDGLTQFFAAMPENDLPIWLTAIAVHEATHCIEQREAYIDKRFDRVLPPDFRRDDMTVQGYRAVVKSGAVETWDEALADIVSVLYLKQTAPDRWAYFAAGIAAMRHELAGKWPEHDTSSWLNQVIAANPVQAPHQSLFEAGLRLCRQFRPG
jgi:hypothetical protein